ncbi:MAG TPA: CRISPR-associated RAMP protein Csx7 [Candidatus Angelobacter sp.]|nr:CRISPR-associated RAMP protein Csx7 [Candidatus Angelobacter sp.]
MSEVLGFLKLENRYLIKGVLVPETGLHIGSGQTGDRTDAPVFQDGKGPLVPGSSLRGVLRSTAEKILQSLGDNRGCVLFTKQTDATHSTCFTVNDKLMKTFHESIATRERNERERLLHEKLLRGDGLCDICRLFGSPLLASKLKIGDLRPINPKTIVRDGVGIDRDTETAREHIKYDFEVLYCEKLEFRAEIENATGTDLALLGILLREMKSPGIDLGGKKSRGLGRCCLQDHPLDVTGFDTPAGLRQFFLKGVPLPVPDFHQKVESALRNYLEVN